MKSKKKGKPKGQSKEPQRSLTTEARQGLAQRWTIARRQFRIEEEGKVSNSPQRK
jgi:hypothetical protein